MENESDTISDFLNTIQHIDKSFLKKYFLNEITTILLSIKEKYSHEIGIDNSNLER